MLIVYNLHMEITIFAAIAAGIGSFLSPCVLPIIPAFLSYISGSSINELRTQTLSISRLNLVINTIFFILGFSMMFSIIGVILNTTLSTLSTSIISNLTLVGGVIIIIFGIYLLASSKLLFLNKEFRFNIKRFKTNYLTSLIFGIIFAGAWTPCVGPILGSIFALAASMPADAFNLLLAYSTGLGIPFLLMSIFISKSLSFIARAKNYLKYFNVVAGSMLIILGVLVASNNLILIGNFPLIESVMNI